jgi:hypothetical protein
MAPALECTLALEGVHAPALVPSARDWDGKSMKTWVRGEGTESQMSPSPNQVFYQILPGDAGSQPSSGPSPCIPCYQRAWGSGSCLAPSGRITK